MTQNPEGTKAHDAFHQNQAASVVTIPPFVLTDSYKVTHFDQYAPARRMVAYGEFRASWDRDPQDHRLIFYGLTRILCQYIYRRWTMEELDQSAEFFSTFNTGAYTAYPFPRDLFAKFIGENDGYFPVKIEALREGTVAYPHVPVYQITAEKDYARLVTFLETVLTMVWYPSNVATLSRRIRTKIEEGYKMSVTDSDYGSLESRLHDFGFRGCACVEQAMVGGSAHLLNFQGTDTAVAAYHVKNHLNGGEPIGNSIPATEHSVMTSWPTEKQAVEHMIQQYGEGVYACVMDSYDYTRALAEVLPAVKEHKLEKGGYMVIRPDSGDQVECVLEGLHALENVFGSTVNDKGYKVINGAGIIQGDGVTSETLSRIIDAMMRDKFALNNTAFGMGGGLLQKHHRDTMNFATKLCFIEGDDGSRRNVMKLPKTDAGKTSLPGELAVYLMNCTKVPKVYPKGAPQPPDSTPLLHVYYDGLDPSRRRVPDHLRETFAQMRQRINQEWADSPLTADVISQELQAVIEETKAHGLGRPQV